MPFGRTRPPLNSTQTAFFLLFVHSCPATVGVMVFGGICRKPGPSFRGNVGCDGSEDGSNSCPGRTNIVAAIGIQLIFGYITLNFWMLCKKFSLVKKWRHPALVRFL